MSGSWMLMLALSGPAMAQDGEGEPPAADQVPVAEENSDLAQKPELLQLLELPAAADRYRQSGASEADTGKVLESMKAAGVPASEAAVVLEQANQAAREHGPTDNFGAFVQTQLEAGKRGQELADAIHEEHKANGKGQVFDGRPDGDVSNDPGTPDGMPPTAKDSPDGVAPEGRPEDPAVGRDGAAPPQEGGAQ